MRKWTRSTHQQLKEDYRVTFGPACGPSAERVFMDLYERSGMTSTNFVPGLPDQSAFNDGCRSLFLRILQMTYEPEEIPQQIKEIASREMIE